MMDGNAIIYCQGAFNTPGGKTAHSLVRFTKRYKILSVIDANFAGKDSGVVLDGIKSGIPIVATLEDAMENARVRGERAEYLIVGLAPENGRLNKNAKEDIRHAIDKGLNVDSGLHELLAEDQVLMNHAVNSDTKIRDIKKTPRRKDLHFFTGKITEVNCIKIAVLGTDSTVGKSTSAWKLLLGLEKSGLKTELIGTGQTSWLQGAKYSIVLDSLINRYLTGEIENIIYEAWINEQPDIIIIEGQGSLMSPVFPGGAEILAAAMPDFIILQHAPTRTDYDGCPGHKIQPLKQQIKAIELLSGKKVIAITINHDGILKEKINQVCESIKKETGIPAFDLLHNPPDELVSLILSLK